MNKTKQKFKILISIERQIKFNSDLPKMDFKLIKIIQLFFYIVSLKDKISKALIKIK